MSKNAGNVAGGLKATLNNPRVSDEAKNNAQERLDQLDSGAPVEEIQSQTSANRAEKNTGNVIGGYKATLNNPKVSEQAKQNARQKLDSGELGDNADADYIPEQ